MNYQWADWERKVFASYDDQEPDADWEWDEGDADEEYEGMMAEYERITAERER
jgi:hypothetical protein